VTVVEIIETSAGPGDGKTYFTADHPFVFVIREKTSNAILFIGKVGNPVY
jgi:serine protease inhibitor